MYETIPHKTIAPPVMRHAVRIALRSCLRLTRPSINKGSANIMHSPITILIMLKNGSSEIDGAFFITQCPHPLTAYYGSNYITSPSLYISFTRFCMAS